MAGLPPQIYILLADLLTEALYRARVLGRRQGGGPESLRRAHAHTSIAEADKKMAELKGTIIAITKLEQARSEEEALLRSVIELLERASSGPLTVSARESTIQQFHQMVRQLQEMGQRADTTPSAGSGGS